MKIIIVIGIFAGMLAFFKYYFFYSMSRLPKGEFLEEAVSPDGKYTVKVYLSRVALSSDAIRGEVINNRTKKVRNIYWQYRASRAEITWKNEETVIINDIELNVLKDVYDWRRDRNK